MTHGAEKHTRKKEKKKAKGKKIPTVQGLFFYVCLFFKAEKLSFWLKLI